MTVPENSEEAAFLADSVRNTVHAELIHIEEIADGYVALEGAIRRQAEKLEATRMELDTARDGFEGIKEYYDHLVGVYARELLSSAVEQEIKDKAEQLEELAAKCRNDLETVRDAVVEVQTNLVETYADYTHVMGKVASINHEMAELENLIEESRNRG